MLEEQGVTCLRVGADSPMLSSLPTIGENIRKLRVAAGYRHQGEFAKRVGVPQSRLSDWENDRYKTIDTPSLLKLAKAIGCPIGALLHGVDADYDVVALSILAGESRDTGDKPTYGFALLANEVALIEWLRGLSPHDRTAALEAVTERASSPLPSTKGPENASRKTRASVTSAVTPLEVEDRLPVSIEREAAHAAAEETPAAAGPADRLSESEDVEMRVRADILSRFRRKELAQRLLATADEIRAVATALRAGAPAPATQTKEPAAPRGRAGVRHGHARRRKGE